MAATAFITLDDLKNWKDPAGSIQDTSGDVSAELVIDAVCNAMEEHLRRPVVARELSKVSDGGVTRIFLAHQNPGYLSVTAVVEDGVTLTTTLDYLVYQREGYVARVRTGAFAPFLQKPQAVTVTYSAGVAQTANDVPKNLKVCAIIAARYYLGLGHDDFGKRFADGTSVSTDDFPKQCKWLMKPYRLSVGGTT